LVFSFCVAQFSAVADEFHLFADEAAILGLFDFLHKLQIEQRLARVVFHQGDFHGQDSAVALVLQVLAAVRRDNLEVEHPPVVFAEVLLAEYPATAANFRVSLKDELVV